DRAGGELAERVEPDVAEVRRVRALLFQRGGEVVAAVRPHAHDEVDVGAVQQVAQLARRGERADGNGDRAHPYRGEPREHEVETGREQQPDPTAATGARGQHPAREHAAATF